MEKISFLYVSEIVAGKIASPMVHRPEPWVIAKHFPFKTSFDVNFGLIIMLHLPYRVDFDVFLDDGSLLEGDREPISAEPIFARSTHSNDYVSVENMRLRNVSIKTSGLHRVTATLLGQPDKDGNLKVLHKAESFFFVSDEWTN